ncbi:hypothetical protein K491DRAFT_732310 [Lophiostoma macrostomum CBS 122681]|uniref:SH3 domain-containing protein n=1 Tax=Lophiostoma macrostomum CBS 122681 TaxID=1314788 RepID=A0A6A6TJT2_9PLEO|nr:hypothetical protein K491DRAFT_732310 [Lophiostoma macrostomum CBS 122681]
MTRPQIIRADTLDLQDKTSPTAQDHTNQPAHPGAPLGIGPAAPHQEASLRRVDDERHAEESHLQNSTSWSETNTLREDPGSDDERTIVDSVNGDRELQQDEQAVRLNGGMSGSGDDGDMQDADAEEDMDDDMMDKISSSPSIDDGGYSSPSLPEEWPVRSASLSSLTPRGSPAHSPAASYSTCADSSSPFTTTPLHFPISTVAAARRPFPVPARGEENIPTSSHRPSSTSFLSQSTLKKIQNLSTNHHRGEYPRILEANTESGHFGDDEVSPRTGHRMRVEDRLQNNREDSQSSVFSELDEEDIKIMLQPVRTPERESSENSLEEAQAEAGSAPDKDYADEDGSWETDSDADSWDTANEDDDSNDVSFSDDPRFVDSGWGGECLRETEDIDFEFVYALHTFVATVEGQANATKGDTMVLLDDSNSYWWLVRVVKDSSIGYLPAEHIETPTERLARLNKHRNIDLSATMLGDTAEKTKNPLKKAMRRRNAKTVQFAAPTYVEASDYDYSSDEGGDELFGGADPNQVQAQAATEKVEPEQEDGLKVQPLKVNGSKKEAGGTDSEPVKDVTEDSTTANGDKPRTSDEIFDRPLEQKVTRNGTLRNTDSFFKDDNAETRKITITPNLLRDDSSTSTTGSRERGPSLESLEKNGFADKVKDDKKKKEKKPGMLSGLFKRKEKKPKGALDSFDSDAEKQSEDIGRSSPQSKDSDERPSNEQAAQSPQRNSSKGKLQKPRSRDDSPSKPKGIIKTDSPEPSTVQAAAPADAPSNKPQAASQSSATMRLVSPERDESPKPTPVEERVTSPVERSRSNAQASKYNPMNMLKGQQPNDDPRPSKVKKAKQRVQLDDFDSEEDDKNDPFADPESGPAPTAADSEPTGRLSESPVQISAADAQPPGKETQQDKEQEADSHQPPGLTADTSSQETPSPVSTPSPTESPTTAAPSKPNLSASRAAADSPSPTRLNTALPPPTRPAPIPTKEKEMEPSPPVSSESTTLPAWSDSSLRTYLDDGSDIRDMLVVINDTTGVQPVGRDHPLMAQLFVEETKAVTQLGGELDSLLNNWLETKRKKHKVPSPPKPATR